MEKFRRRIVVLLGVDRREQSRFDVLGQFGPLGVELMVGGAVRCFVAVRRCSRSRGAEFGRGRQRLDGRALVVQADVRINAHREPDVAVTGQRLGRLRRDVGLAEVALLPFWKRLRASRARIEAVATDMSPAYIDAVTSNLPEATLVFDRFHVIKLYTDKLSELRRELHRHLADTMQKKVLKGVRWLLLKRPENLDPTRREPERLAEALRLNEPLAIAYHLKDQLREIWEQDDQETAQALLLDWIAYAESSGLRMLRKFARTLRFHAFGILAWYDYPISTGPLEGTNNKIKTMKRQAYGFRDPNSSVSKFSPSTEQPTL